MGRKSALTAFQWAEIERRILLEGESAFSMAKEFGVNESSIRRKIKPTKADSAQKADLAQKSVPELRALAQRKAASDDEARRVAEQISKLPQVTQYVVCDLSARLSAISGNLASAAELGSATAHRLAAIANAQVGKIDDVNPMESQDVLQAISGLTKLSNDASVIGINLLKANADMVDRINNPAASKADPADVLKLIAERLAV